MPAREAAGQAERGGMLGLAALGMGDFGYGFLSLRRYEPAAEALLDAVKIEELQRFGDEPAPPRGSSHLFVPG